jgi:hypothetical protein
MIAERGKRRHYDPIATGTYQERRYVPKTVRLSEHGEQMRSENAANIRRRATVRGLWAALSGEQRRARTQAARAARKERRG